jgi:putative CocE/NonD family hydrolase
MDIVVQKNISVPMRDGVRLAADLYRPAAGGPWPTLLIRTPYNKDQSWVTLLLAPDPLLLAQAGYAVLVQDCRGCFGSGGALEPYFHEGRDGADTLRWAAAQPWSNGATGMLGGSYLGAAQWLAAAEAPEAVQALAPFITADQFHTPWSYQGGAFQLGFLLYWALGYFALPELQRRLARREATLADVAAAMHALGRIDELYRRTPLTATPELDAVAPFYHDWLAHPDAADPYWRPVAGADYGRIGAPALNIGGWYDTFLGGTLASYQGMRDRGGSEAARRPGLIVGPWSHGNWHGVFPERDFGLLAGVDAADLSGAQIRWFDYWLKGEENGVAGDAPVRLFIMGADRWREEEDWPLPDTQYRRLYLRGAGRANSLHGDGALAWEPPGDEPHDSYSYDPADPVPTCGGATLLPGAMASVNGGPRDQRAVEARPDVLVYTTPPLDRPVEVTGPVRLVLFAASSARDTDFTGKLVDVFPDGRAILLTDGILRARYRDGPSPRPLEPGAVATLELDLGATANLFRPGHRIRLEIASSNFPRFDRNTNTGGVIAEEGEADAVAAVNRVFHDAARPSHLLLPVIERP